MIYGLLYAYWCIQVQLLIELSNILLPQCPVTAILPSVLMESHCKEEDCLACDTGVAL